MRVLWSECRLQGGQCDAHGLCGVGNVMLLLPVGPPRTPACSRSLAKAAELQDRERSLQSP